MKNNASEAPGGREVLNTGITMDKRDFQVLVGRRLAQVRKSIKPKLTQEKLAQATNLHQNIIQRLEAGHGSMDNLLVVLNYYLNENYNLNYLLAEFNMVYAPTLTNADRVFNLNDYFELPE